MPIITITALNTPRLNTGVRISLAKERLRYSTILGEKNLAGSPRKLIQVLQMSYFMRDQFGRASKSFAMLAQLSTTICPAAPFSFDRRAR
ncbi:hypothetical protein ACVWYQ_006608 [Bradyrhizobium sp. USDA 3397]|uniref:hypothetical protein n=1 Tax=Bradyrhizobium yuanmingense TaxID=108015 RepID=UPI0023B9A8BD|nr:hypothetical protein [Bradyrhizobium yuanmingense]MDF0515832.1 hypothetical protein [Bradyrhizobium yuanmingense]